jgi:hypothetical protein
MNYSDTKMVKVWLSNKEKKGSLQFQLIFLNCLHLLSLDFSSAMSNAFELFELLISYKGPKWSPYQRPFWFNFSGSKYPFLCGGWV